MFRIIWVRQWTTHYWGPVDSLVRTKCCIYLWSELSVGDMHSNSTRFLMPESRQFNEIGDFKRISMSNPMSNISNALKLTLLGACWKTLFTWFMDFSLSYLSCIIYFQSGRFSRVVYFLLSGQAECFLFCIFSLHVSRCWDNQPNQGQTSLW